MGRSKPRGGIGRALYVGVVAGNLPGGTSSTAVDLGFLPSSASLPFPLLMAGFVCCRSKLSRPNVACESIFDSRKILDDCCALMYIRGAYALCID